MCGICGFTWTDELLLKSMVSSLKHRGPDGNGTFLDERVSIGHTRLSIIDLSETGHQPMASSDGQVTLSYNGEIYNFETLRQELLAKGYIFRGTSDTEVFLYSYVEWGIDAFNKFNGMWAACIYDKRSGTLVLSRDRIGVKPLYFSHDNQRLIFASEIKAILHHDVSREINPVAIDMLLSAQFIPSPMSIFKSIQKVEPRQYLIFNLASGELAKRYYYDIPKYDPIYDKDHLLTTARALLDDSVRSRLVADVPVGAFLSGGVDSTTIVAIMKKDIIADQLHTISVGFDIPGLDESKYIHLANQSLQTLHHHIIFCESDTDRITEDLFRIYDEPVADPSSFPTYSLCQETKKWLKVALSGDGGDEIFGGYESRRVVAQFALVCCIPRPIRNLLHSILKYLYGYRFDILGKITEAFRVSLLEPHDYPAEIGATLVYRPESYKNWARDKLKILLPLSGGNLTEAMLKFDIYFNRLGDNYAAKVDRISMAHSLEVRSPLLDYRFMEFSARIPVKWKLTAFKTKLLMKELVRGLIPDAIIDRQKHGFAGPLGAWIDQNEPMLLKALEKLRNDAVIDDKWHSFFKERVFVEPNPIYREYKKRLYFLWNWHKTWGNISASKNSTTPRYEDGNFTTRVQFQQASTS